MGLTVKICGITNDAELHAVIAAKPDLIGFVFHKGSRHLVTPERAASMAKQVPSGIIRTGLLVDANDDDIKSLLATVPLDLLQLHGDETPERVAHIRSQFGLPVIVARRIATAEHLADLSAYEQVADRLLFDARVGEVPTGGTGKSFNWALLQGRVINKPWMLAGGLNAANLAEAVRTSGANAVDISSGVEGDDGHKSCKKVKEFITLAHLL